MIAAPDATGAMAMPSSAAARARGATPDGEGAEPQRRGTGRRLRGAVVNHLGSDIVSGLYAPGQVLPSEVEGAEALNVSRGAYREAIRTLAAKGLVDSRPRAGTTVQPRQKWNLLDADVLMWTFTSQPDIAIVRSLFELRAMVEPWAAGLAAERRTKADVKALRDALSAMARHGLENPAGQAADCAFHDAILKATGNDYLAVLTGSIGAAVAMTTQFKQRSRALPRDPIPSHRRVLDAIVAGDPAAASAAMRTLVDHALEDTRQAME